MLTTALIVISLLLVLGIVTNKVEALRGIVGILIVAVLWWVVGDK